VLPSDLVRWFSVLIIDRNVISVLYSLSFEFYVWQRLLYRHPCVLLLSFVIITLLPKEKI